MATQDIFQAVLSFDEGQVKALTRKKSMPARPWITILNERFDQRHGRGGRTLQCG